MIPSFAEVKIGVVTMRSMRHASDVTRAEAGSGSRGDRKRRRTVPMLVSNLLAGQRIPVTGGGTGLCKSVSRRYAEPGCTTGSAFPGWTIMAPPSPDRCAGCTDVIICGRRVAALEEPKEIRDATGGQVPDHAGALPDEGKLVRRAVGTIPGELSLMKSQSLTPGAADRPFPRRRRARVRFRPTEDGA